MSGLTDSEFGRLHGHTREYHALLSESARLRKALEAARRKHEIDCDEMTHGQDLDCTCGADAHNDAISAALSWKAPGGSA